jgi:uncharacterized protein YecT (DUF1311 family)
MVNFLYRMKLRYIILFVVSWGYIFADDIITQYDMNIDALNKKILIQNRLEKVTRTYKSKLNVSQKKLFITAENNWKEYVSSYCKFTTSNSIGGSIHGMIMDNCIKDQTNGHIKLIISLMACKEGDLRCVLI